MSERDGLCMIRNKKGFTMPMVIFIIAVVVIIIAIIFSYNTNYASYNTNITNMEKALQIAEAGINAYLYHLSQDPDFHRDTKGIQIKDGSEELGLVPLSFDDEGLPIRYKITSCKDNKNNTVGFYQISLVQPAFNRDLEIISTGWTNDDEEIRKTVSIKLKNNNFCEYLLFTNGENTFYTGNTIKGSVFSNEDINIVSSEYGNPKFEEDLISAKSINTTGNPRINGAVLQHQPKMRFPDPADNKEKIAKYADLSYTGRTCILLNGKYLKIRNHTDGDTLQTKEITKPYTIFVKDGPVFISGELNGRLTVYSTEDIYITGKDPTNMYIYSAAVTGGIKYSNTNIPNKNSSGGNYSNDMLGLISENNIIIATRTWPDSTNGTRKLDQTPVSSKDMTIYGTLMAADNIEIEDSYPYFPTLNTLKLYGSQVCKNINLQSKDEYNAYKELTNTYDYRLKTDYPLYIVSSEYSEWVIKAWEELLSPPN